MILSNDNCSIAIYGTGDLGVNFVTKGLHRVGIRPAEVNATSSDDALDEERMNYTRQGEKEPGFASAMVPTMEEKTVAEHRPPTSQAEDSPIGDELEHRKSDANENTSAGREAGEKPSGVINPAQETPAEPNGTVQEARTPDGDLYGAPADASKSAKTDDQPPHARSGVDDADEQEQAAPGARTILRKHLNANLGSKMWSLPTPTPKVDPQGFEDPVSDEFWKNVWVACAVHNVRSLFVGGVLP
jgi:phospholipase D1/2